MNPDDEWAYDRLVEDPGLCMCISARVTIDGITHRALAVDWADWRTLCGLHKLVVFAGRTFAVTGRSLQVYDFSSFDVDCMCCLPAGG